MTVKLIVQAYELVSESTNHISRHKVTRHACLENIVKHLAMHDLTPHGVFMHNMNMILAPYNGQACAHDLNIIFEFPTQSDLTQFVLAWS